MTYRKTWPDHVIWFLYTSLCVMLLAASGNTVYYIYVKAAPAKLGAILIFPLLACVYLALRQGSLGIRRRVSFSLHSRQMIEAFSVSVSFVFGFLVRLKVFRYVDLLRISSGAQEAEYFMEKAFVRAGEGIEPIAHGVSYLYVCLLSAVFSFLGNSAGAAMFLQIVLQLLAMLLGYRLMKAAAGRFAACLCLLLMAFSPVYVERAAAVTPECLFLLLYLIGLSAAVFYVRAVFSGSPFFQKIITAAIPGALIGVLIYFELSAVTILLFFAALFKGKRRKEEAGERRNTILRLFTVIVSCFAAFFVLIAADAAISGISLEKSLYVWISPYLQAGFPLTVTGEWHRNLLFCTVLFLAASFLIMEFIRSGKEEDHSPWFIFCILFTPFLFWEIWTVRLSVLALFFWSVAASLGVKNCLFGRAAEVVQAKIEGINAAANPAFAPSGPVPSGEIPSEQRKRFLENPLPLPKKHVKKEMDYDYAVAPEMMHFDVEPAAEDDFTI